MQRPTTEEILEACRYDTAMRAPALYLFTSPLLDSGRVWKHVTLAPFRIDFRSMVKRGGWSSGERILIDCAWSFWNGDQKISLIRAVHVLSEDNSERLVVALQIAMGFRDWRKVAFREHPAPPTAGDPSRHLDDVSSQFDGVYASLQTPEVQEGTARALYALGEPSRADLRD